MSPENPILTIMMVNFNHGQFIGEAIDSIISQQSDQIEVVVIDGGSTDQSVYEIERRRKYISYFVSEKDNGQSDAFNKAVAASKGKYLTWLNADDVLVSGSIERLVHVLQSANAKEWYAGNTIFTDELLRVRWFSFGMRPIRFLLDRGIHYVSGPSTVFSRNLFDKCGPFDVSLKYTMDGDLWMRFITSGIAYERLSFPIWAFRIHEDSKTSHAFERGAVSKFAEERALIYSRYNAQPTVWFRVAYRMLRVFSYSALKSALYSSRYRGRPISSVRVPGLGK